MFIAQCLTVIRMYQLIYGEISTVTAFHQLLWQYRVVYDRALYHLKHTRDSKEIVSQNLGIQPP